MTTFLYFAIIFFTSIYTASYAVFEWKKKKRLCACAVFLLCATEIALPFIRMFLS